MSKEEKITELKQKGDLNGLVKIIKNADEWMLRRDAAKALAQLGDKRGLNYLIHTLDDPDANIRDGAREILDGLNDPRGNQALLQPRKRDIAQSESDNNSTSHVIEKGIIKKATRSQIKRKPKNNDSYLRTVLIIIVIAGILILIDSFSWSKGGMNGLGSMIVVFLAVFALIIVSALALIANLARSRNRENNSRAQDSLISHTAAVNERINAPSAPRATDATGEPPTKSSSSSSTPNWESRLPTLVPIIFILVSVLIITIYSISTTRRSYGEWYRVPHPAGSKIREIVTSDTTFVIIKTESGRTYISNPDSYDCRFRADPVDCWDTNIEAFNFIEEDAVNDGSCPGEARLPNPPVQRASKESVYRNCGLGFTTREIRLFISEGGDLWYWNEHLVTNSDIFTMAMYMSCLAIPISALIGAVSVWLFFKTRERR